MQPNLFIDNEFYTTILNLDFGKPQTKTRKRFYYIMISYLYFKTPNSKTLLSAAKTNAILEGSKFSIIFNNKENKKKIEKEFYEKYETKLPSYEETSSYLDVFYNDKELEKLLSDDYYVPILRESILKQMNFENGAFESLPFKQNANISYVLWIFYIDKMWTIIDKETNYPFFSTLTQNELHYDDLNHQNLLSETLKQVLSENINDYLNDYDSSSFEYIYKKLEKLTEKWILNDAISSLVTKNINRDDLIRELSQNI